MRIGELSRRLGISERALRYYEEQGLLRPARESSGYRDYSDADLETVRRIRTLLSAGLGTQLIGEVLPCMRDAGELVAPGCPELIPYLVGERDRISRTVDELQTARAILDAIIASTPSPTEQALVCPTDGATPAEARSRTNADGRVQAANGLIAAR